MIVCDCFGAFFTDKPTQPLGPLDIIESSSVCIDFKWRIPKDNGGSPITGYILERQQIGRNSWKKLGNVGMEPKYRDTDVDHGRKYCYHIWAETDQGISEMMETDDIQAGTKGWYTDELSVFCLGFLFCFVFFQHSVYSPAV